MGNLVINAGAAGAVAGFVAAGAAYAIGSRPSVETEHFQADVPDGLRSGTGREWTGSVTGVSDDGRRLEVDVSGQVRDVTVQLDGAATPRPDRVHMRKLVSAYSDHTSLAVTTERDRSREEVSSDRKLAAGIGLGAMGLAGVGLLAGRKVGGPVGAALTAASGAALVTPVLAVGLLAVLGGYKNVGGPSIPSYGP